MQMSNPVLNDFRKLALVLPPSERVNLGEIGDTLSAVLAYITHGQPLLDAAEAGAQAIADFYHEHATKAAAQLGADPPVKGAPVESGPPQGVQQPAGGVSPSEFATLARQIQTLTDAIAHLQSGAGSEAPASSTPASSSPAPATPLTPEPETV